MVRVDVIRAAFPHPQILDVKSKNYDMGYCVGGAVCSYAFPDYVNVKRRFPGPSYISLALVDLNSKLSLETAREYAYGIVSFNESGNFVAAWKEVEEALSYKGAK